MSNFEELIEKNRGLIYNYALRLCKNSADAEDVMQDACIKAFRFFEQYDNSRPFNSWMLAIVNSVFLDFQKRKRCRPKTISYDRTLLESGDDFEFSDKIYDIDSEIVSIENVNKILSGLTYRQRGLIIARDILDLPFEKIVPVLGEDIIALRNRKYRTHKQIKANFQSLPISDTI